MFCIAPNEQFPLFVLPVTVPGQPQRSKENRMESHQLISAGPIRDDRVDIFGVGVSPIDMDDAIATIERWISSGSRNYVCIRDVHGVMESRSDQRLLRCLIEGYSNKCIARKIDIAEATVKVHVKAILRKIRVQNRTQAAIWGMNNGSLKRPADDSSPPSTASKRPPIPLEVISEIKKIGASVPASANGHDANHVDVSRIDRLNRKVHQPKD
jgi:DNA-binding CsgD family transcriptional regulator